MQVKYIILSILLLIILLISYLIIIFNLYKTDYNDNNNYRVYKKILYSNLKPYLKSGDLLFFSSTNASIKTRSWINSRFAHVGMIIKINNKLYVIELVGNDEIRPLQPSPISGIIVNPLFTRIVNYSGSVYYSSLNLNLSKEKEQQLKEYIKYSDKYKYNETKKILYSLLTHSKKLDTYNRFCTEFIAEILDNLDISSKPLNSSKLNLPNEIFKLTDGKIYTNPIHILCDGLMVNKVSEGSYMTYC